MIDEPRVDNDAQQVEMLDRAIWRKWNKYIWSGLLILGVGCLMIVVGLLLRSGAYSAEGLLVGFGAIVVFIGLIRIAIGLINPLSPADLYASKSRYQGREGEEQQILDTLR